MSELVTTRYAMRVMGVWIRRADALLHEGALGNAASVLHDERQRSARQAVELAEVNMQNSTALPATG